MAAHDAQPHLPACNPHNLPTPYLCHQTTLPLHAVCPTALQRAHPSALGARRLGKAGARATWSSRPRKYRLGDGPPGETGHAQGNSRQAARALLSERTGSTAQQTWVTDSAGAVTEARGTGGVGSPAGVDAMGPEQHRVVRLSSAWQT